MQQFVNYSCHLTVLTTWIFCWKYFDSVVILRESTEIPLPRKIVIGLRVLDYVGMAALVA
jgi:hypothetical protein